MILPASPTHSMCPCLGLLLRIIRGMSRNLSLDIAASSTDCQMRASQGLGSLARPNWAPMFPNGIVSRSLHYELRCVSSTTGISAYVYTYRHTRTRVPSPAASVAKPLGQASSRTSDAARWLDGKVD